MMKAAQNALETNYNSLSNEKADLEAIKRIDQIGPPEGKLFKEKIEVRSTAICRVANTTCRTTEVVDHQTA